MLNGVGRNPDNLGMTLVGPHIFRDDNGYPVNAAGSPLTCLNAEFKVVGEWVKGHANAAQHDDDYLGALVLAAAKAGRRRRAMTGQQYGSIATTMRDADPRAWGIMQHPRGLQAPQEAMGEIQRRRGEWGAPHQQSGGKG